MWYPSKALFSEGRGAGRETNNRGGGGGGSSSLCCSGVVKGKTVTDIV